jgi:UDP-GlcNAc:undecaprenyl-phosphate GlcNAc-1-phosphate transferase
LPQEVFLPTNSNMIVTGFAIAGLMSVLLIFLAPYLGWVDQPDQNRKCHQCPIALTGGLALWGVLTLARFLGWLPWPLQRIDWIGINSMALMGALDDRFDLRARHKAIVGLLVAALMAANAASVLHHSVSQVSFLYIQVPTHPLLTFPLLVIWLWSIPQAYNLIDGVNGLSMGLALLVLGVLSGHMGAQPMVMWGALSATLLLNFPHAKHFLGDCGAMMLGTLFAILSLKLLITWNANLPLWVFAYPIVDVTMVVSIRAWNGRPLGGADRSHLHHWMMDRLNNRVWLVTPILLVFAALPMLRATGIAGSREISTIGGILLIGLASKAFWDRTHLRSIDGVKYIPLQHNVRFIGSTDTTTAHGSQRAS